MLVHARLDNNAGLPGSTRILETSIIVSKTTIGCRNDWETQDKRARPCSSWYQSAKDRGFLSTQQVWPGTTVLAGQVRPVPGAGAVWTGAGAV